jgi:pimeloyl-ACP methyl ester carboxylesterase/quercetin dioxygenase-like cupin family protein
MFRGAHRCILAGEEKPMRRIFLIVATFVAMTAIAFAQPALPPDFKQQTITTPDGAQIYVRSGGSGPAVLLIHGFGDAGEMWGPVARELRKTHTLVIPDLRGMGRSSHPAGGYDKRTQAADLRAVMLAFGIDRSAVVGHDIGNMIAYAYAARYPDKVERLIVMDAPIPGIDPWDEVKCSPQTWHFNFRGPDVERLVQGRERILLDRFYNELSAHPERIDEATRAHYAAVYAQPGAMHSAFEQFAAFSKDAEDNKVTQRTKLPMPVLAVGGAKSFGALMAVNMRNIADDVTEAIVPEAGHWLMEENPEATVALIGDFLSEKQRAAGDRRMAPAEYQFSSAIAGGTGTSSVEGIRTVVVKGDPNTAGLYTIMLYVPANTRIAAHQHRDDRVATVVSGTWYFGYGDEFDAAALKALPAGSYYTEPPHRAHFAETRGEPVVVQISGVGPSDTEFIKAKGEAKP